MDLTEDQEAPAVEVEALRALLASEGWRAFDALVQQEWGASRTLARIDDALKVVARGDDAAVTDTVQQIQTARREILKVLQLPAQRILQLKPEKISTNPLHALRRMTTR